ncbi:hypothetical protein SRRS_45080 [Sporomusa rhizae]|uniref:hypothetical protein n=1 Tax=Sporomusa rhizae TaxID=357999 RepID=UPI00352BD051
MSDKVSTNQKFNAQLLPEFTLPAVVVTAPRLRWYDWYGIWKNIFAAIDPQSPVFINPTLSHQNILDGYRLRENPLKIGLSWRVTASGRVHPDDVKQYIKQEKTLYSHMLPAVEDAATKLSQESSNAESKNTEFNSDAIYWSYDLSPIPPSEVGGKMEMSKSTVDGLKAAGSVALDASGEFALDRGSKGGTIILPNGKVITSETLKTFGEATKGIGVLLDAKDVKEYGEQVFQEAKNRGFSDEDADGIAHRAAYNYLGWFKLPERGGQALLASRVSGGGYAGTVLGEFLESNFQDDLKDYFMNRVIKEYMADKENWQNFKAPDPSAYYNRTR